MTTVYFIRHSKCLKVNNDFNNDSIQLKNEKQILSLEGEKIAKEKLNIEELKNIDAIYSSNYVRAIQTAQYIAYNNNLDINVISDLGERKIGISSWNEYPEDFEIHQLNDNGYKLPNGESLKEVRERALNVLYYILENSKDKKIALVFHSTTMMTLLNTWCEVSYDSDYYFHGRKFFNGKWDYCEMFKLEFDLNKKLISIKNLDNREENKL